MSPDAVSVIVPAYRAGNLLPASLEAIAASRFPPGEVIVVIDGEEDESMAQAARSRGARVLTLPRRVGPGGARNAGARAAGGRILIFIDADVCVAPEAIGRLVSALEESPEIDAAFGSYDASPPRANFVSQYRNLLHHYVHQQGQPKAQTFWAGLGAIRREAFEAMEGFDAKRYPRPSIEDIELGERLRSAGRRVRLLKAAQGT